MRLASLLERRQPPPGVQLRWWREVLLIGAFYLVYTWVRNQFGSAAVGPRVALDNAEWLIDIEKAIGTYQELRIQRWFLDWTVFMQFWNVFYGTFHFAVTAFTLLYLYRRFPGDYSYWRTVGLTTTGLALIGFATFPVMPPRLLGDFGDFGGRIADSGFVDTMAEIGGLWSFDSGTMEKLSNQYAAMPSLHIGWSSWCALALFPRLSSRVGKAIIALYPWATLFAIVVTANHYWIDAVGGLGAVGLALPLAAAIGRWNRRSDDGPPQTPPSEGAPARYVTEQVDAP